MWTEIQRRFWLPWSFKTSQAILTFSALWLPKALFLIMIQIRNLAQPAKTFKNQRTPILYWKSTFLYAIPQFSILNVLHCLIQSKKGLFYFLPNLISSLWVSFLSYVTKQKRKKWRKLIKRSIFWSKISKKDYLQQGDISFMFKNRHRKQENWL